MLLAVDVQESLFKRETECLETNVSMKDITLNELRDDELRAQLENHKFHVESRAKIASLVNKSTIMRWFSRDSKPNEFDTFLKMFDNMDDITNLSDEQKEITPEMKEDVWSDQSRYLVHDENLCCASKGFEKAGSVKKHVLLTHLNENWGALSTSVANRTAQWGNIENILKLSGGCSLQSITEYLDHPNTLAVFTTTHQAIDHPKVHSIPLGIKTVSTYLKIIESAPSYKTQLLMLNSRASEERNCQLEAVIKSFREESIEIMNSYKEGSDYRYLSELQRSKFILCPSGMGWDTYRMWEAFMVGTIPVVEHYNRTDGWHRTMNNLPILWVENFEHGLKPSFLEKEYQRIAMNASRYMYEKLTIPYWINFVKSFSPKKDRSNSTSFQYKHVKNKL